MTRKLVGDRIYDTEQAVIVVGKYAYGADDDTAEQSLEELYRTPDGSWFLHASREGHRGASPALDITPLVAQEAQRWLLLQGEDAALAEYFAEPASKH